MNNNRIPQTVQSPQGSISGSSDFSASLEQSLVAFGAVAIILFVIAAITFVLWIWSMIAIIDLNSKFKRFLEIYTRNESAGKYRSIRGINSEPNATELEAEGEIKREIVAQTQSKTRLYTLLSLFAALIIIFIVVLYITA